MTSKTTPTTIRNHGAASAASRVWMSAWIWVAAALLLGACAAPGSLVLHGVGRAGVGSPPDIVDATPEQAREGLRIRREGRALEAQVGMPLAAGDSVETLSGTVAVIRFPDGHEAILLPGTRVQLGSIFAEYGEVFVRVFERAKNKFKVKTRYVTAGVEGTSFWMRVDRGDRLSVGVTEGRVTLSSVDARWQPVPLLPDEVATVVGAAAPTKAQVERAQLDSIVRRVGRMRLVPPPPRPPALMP